MDVVDISLNKCRGSNTIELDDGWKLFYSGVESVKFGQAGVGTLLNPQLTNCIDEWMPLEKNVNVELDVEVINHSLLLDAGICHKPMCIVPEIR